jgi:hypothetical protein
MSPSNINASFHALWEQWAVRWLLTGVAIAYTVWGFVVGGGAPLNWPTVTACMSGILALSLIGREYHQTHLLQERLKPKLELTFRPGENPLYDSIHRLKDGTVRHIRVAVMNCGAKSADGVGVMVTRVEPSQAGVYPMQLLRRTHQPDDANPRCTVHKSAEPMVFVELVRQALDADERTSSMRIDFAGNGRLLDINIPYHSVWLTADGEGGGDSIKIVLEKQPNGQFSPRAALFP